MAGRVLPCVRQAVKQLGCAGEQGAWVQAQIVREMPVVPQQFYPIFRAIRQEHLWEV